MPIPPELDLLVWIDLETTGLNEQSDEILAIAGVATTAELEIVDLTQEYFIEHSRPVEEWPEAVQEMHQNNGLIQTLKSEAQPLPVAERAMTAWVQSLGPPDLTPIVGNNIGFDRRFLARYMPEFLAWFHYRAIDVSTVKELVRRWDPDWFAQAPEKKKGHMPIDDLMESIEELKHYRHLFISE